MFDIEKLRADIVSVWGEYGAHVELFDMLVREVNELKKREENRMISKELDMAGKLRGWWRA